MGALDFVVDRSDLRTCRVDTAAEPSAADLSPGQVLARVERFAFTANNVTYAVFGDAMAYWSFFPAAAGWGRIPVWGFGDVIASRHDTIAVGERLYGYLPMSTHVVLQPDHPTVGGFVDRSPHRAALPAAYQRYRRVAGDPGYDARHEDEQALLWPLFMTSFLLEDFIGDHDVFGAGTVVLASASSKTALGLAHLLSKNRPRRCRVVGLTSATNAAFVERVGYYDQVVRYDAVATIPTRGGAVFVDMAGDGKLLHAVHHHFGDALKHSAIVGATHWEARATQHELPGPAPEFFFAPTQLKKRAEEWGPAGLDARFAEAWRSFLGSVGGWLRVVHGRGPAAVEAVYRATLEGRTKPDEGHVLGL